MLTFIPHKINEDYRKVEFYRVNKELCDNELYKDLNPTAILFYYIHSYVIGFLLLMLIKMIFQKRKNIIMMKMKMYM